MQERHARRDADPSQHVLRPFEVVNRRAPISAKPPGQRQVREAPDHMALRSVPLGRGQSPLQVHGGLVERPHLGERPPQHRLGERRPPGMADMLADGHGLSSGLQGAAVLPARPLDPAQVRYEPGLIGLIADLGVEGDRFLDPARGAVPLPSSDRWERGFEHGPLEMPELSGAAEDRLEL